MKPSWVENDHADDLPYGMFDSIIFSNSISGKVRRQTIGHRSVLDNFMEYTRRRPRAYDSTY